MAAFVESRALHAGAFVSEASLQTPSAVVGIASQHASLQRTPPQMHSTPGNTTRSAWPAAFGLSTVAMYAANHKHHRNSRRKGARVPMHVATIDVADNLTKLESGKYERSDVRNVAIIAHVDHGKTTLTDALMTQCGMETKASMDSNQLEMERGITILAKNAAVRYRDVKINIIDTPGHADFGAEVERILNMADACILLVDAQEGPMPQTKFVLRKAIELEKKTMVVINKVDKPAARPDWVLDQTFDLFASLGASDELCDFPVCYASGINGIASVDSPDELADNLKPLLDQILEECPKPPVEPERPLQMLVANLDYDDYVGRICIGRVTSGQLKVGDKIGIMYGEQGEIREASISKLWEFNNNERSPVDEVTAGDICAFAGTDNVVIGDTVVDRSQPLPLPPIEVEEPTVVMEFGVNRSPLAGKLKESLYLTGSTIDKRLQKECMTNLAVRMEPGETSESFKVKGRGTLQLGILMENMRREGFEFMVGAPQVLYRKDPETGHKQEPYEEAVVEVPSEYQGSVMEEFTKKSGVLKSIYRVCG
jgi:GTP-binding protein